MKKIIVLLMLVFIGASTTIYAQESKSESRMLNVKHNVMQKKLGRK